ncbi:hypothetical protein KSP39_PZI007498 [Platanthera zijinensis]|uniref:Potassium channel domain-containing protein n=1 Tax=Platanthera zijinensis TaxID=2320716 RepID=A0AAP0BPE0_9ASPA
MVTLSHSPQKLKLSFPSLSFWEQLHLTFSFPQSSDFFESLRIHLTCIVYDILLTFVLGSVGIYFTEKLHFEDLLYLLIKTITLVGYGDISFKSFARILFATFWLIFAMIAWNIQLHMWSIIIKRCKKN